MAEGDALKASVSQMIEALNLEVDPTLEQIESRICKLMEINKLVTKNMVTLVWEFNARKISYHLKKAAKEYFSKLLSEWGFRNTRDYFEMSQTITWTPKYVGGVFTYDRKESPGIKSILNEKIAALPDSRVKTKLIDGFENMIELMSIDFEAHEARLATLARRSTESITALKAKAKMALDNASDDYSREYIETEFRIYATNRYPVDVRITYTFTVTIMFGRFGLPEFDTGVAQAMEEKDPPSLPQELLQLK